MEYRQLPHGTEKEKFGKQPIRMCQIDSRRITWLYLANEHLRLIASLPSILIKELLMLCIHLSAHQAADNQQ